MHKNIVKYNGKKAAGVTVETTLAILLAVVVLFFVLSIFGDNLKTMVANSGIQRMYTNDQKTTYSTQQYDPTQVNVQVLAEQGNTLNTLDDFKQAATEKINHYKDNPPQNADEVLDLAKWATIARITAGSTILTSSDYGTLLAPNGINIDNLETYSTTVGTARINGRELTINKQFSYIPTNINATAEYQLTQAKTIYNVQYVPISN